MVENERFSLRAAILHERQNYLRGGGGFVGSKKNFSYPPPPTAIIPDARPWRIVLLKVAYYTTSSAPNFAKSCQSSQIMPLPKLCSQNDVDSVHIGAQ